jgi:hypothetical protein
LDYDGDVARPSSLTPELRARIERELGDGIPIVVVAENTSVGRSTLHEWLATGRVARPKREEKPLALVHDLPTERTSPDSIHERLRAAEPGLVAVLVNAAQRGSWQSAAWLLERIDPSRWAKPSRTRALEERPRVPLADDPFAEVDQLAARRRRKTPGR